MTFMTIIEQEYCVSNLIHYESVEVFSPTQPLNMVWYALGKLQGLNYVNVPYYHIYTPT